MWEDFTQRVYFFIDEPVRAIRLGNFSYYVGGNSASLRAEFYGCTAPGKTEKKSLKHPLKILIKFFFEKALTFLYNLLFQLLHQQLLLFCFSFQISL